MDLRDARPLYVNYGGGTDSTAMLIEMVRLGIVPDAIVFADTGSEKPWTIAFVELFSRWLVERGMPPIVTVRNPRSRPSKTGPGYTTLEGNCIQNHTLPSLAFGRKSCSLKWKAAPLDRFYKSIESFRWAMDRGIKPTKLIGYDAGPADSRRAVKRVEDAFFLYRYPLREWGWVRENCVAVIHAVGLPQPGKSACYFCPASKPAELVALAHQHPDLWMRAIMIEDRAQPTLGATVAGLWRRTSWRSFGMANGLPLPPLPTNSELVRHWISNDDPLVEDDDDLSAIEDDPCYQEESAA